MEEGALTHPDVEDATALGMPSRLGEEDIRLFVTLKPGTTCGAEDIRSHCLSVMAKFMVPAVVTILDSMPRTISGKPKKEKLSELPLYACRRSPF